MENKDLYHIGEDVLMMKNRQITINNILNDTNNPLIVQSKLLFRPIGAYELTDYSDSPYEIVGGLNDSGIGSYKIIE